MKFEQFHLMRVNVVSTHPIPVYKTDQQGDYVHAHEAEELLEKYNDAVMTISLMRLATDLETVRAIAAVAIGD
jgi:hypothetical protein